jgi:hypothetical protein
MLGTAGSAAVQRPLCRRQFIAATGSCWAGSCGSPPNCRRPRSYWSAKHSQPAASTRASSPIGSMRPREASLQLRHADNGLFRRAARTCSRHRFPGLGPWDRTPKAPSTPRIGPPLISPGIFALKSKHGPGAGTSFLRRFSGYYVYRPDMWSSSSRA